ASMHKDCAPSLMNRGAVQVLRNDLHQPLRRECSIGHLGQIPADVARTVCGRRGKFPQALACCPKPGMCGLTIKGWVGRVGRAWCCSPGPGRRVAAIIGSWLPWGVICGGSKSVELVCGAFGLTAEPGASLIPVSRSAMGGVWCLDLGAERYAVKELFWESDE